MKAFSVLMQCVMAVQVGGGTSALQRASALALEIASAHGLKHPTARRSRVTATIDKYVFCANFDFTE